MSKHTSFKIGGNTDFLIIVNTTESLVKALKITKALKIKYYILGNGSNMLVSDAGLKGVVIKLGKEFDEIKIMENSVPQNSGNVLIKCSSAVLNSKICLFAKKNGLSGIEFLYGIPGTIGGAVYMNAGAYSKEIKDIILYSECIDENGKILKLNKSDIRLAYRSSIYHETKNIIISASFILKKSEPVLIESTMKNYFLKRKSSQPLNFPNAGSIFKRPKNNLSAGKLIDECGLKETSVGGAMVSPKHAGFIVNTGKATCSDVLKLISIIKKTVKEKTKIELTPEIEIWK